MLAHIEKNQLSIENYFSIIHLHNLFSLPFLVLSLSPFPFLFLIRNLQVNYFETNSFPFYQLSTHNCMIFGFVVFPIIPVGPSPNFINDVSVTISHHIPFQISCLWDKTWSACKNLPEIFGVNFYTVIR